jgi:excinuclease ABC subunit C
MATSDELRKKLDRLPVSPGVYLFRNDQGRIIYIGKAKVLRNRVRSYFMRGNDGRYQYDRLVRAIQDLEVIVTDNELEAMILESSLVRHHVPRYNVTLRDDKSLPYLKVTKELYPRIYLSRRPARDGSRYFGPFTDVQHMKRLLKSLKGILQIRRCNLVITQSSIDRKKHRVCIYYEMGQCAGPCEGLVSPEDYIKNVDMFLDFLKGRTQPLADDLRQQMEDLASDQEFERAAEVRDQLRALEKLTVHQKVISLYAVSRDVIALAREEDDACAVIFRIRDGKLVGRMPFFLKGLGNSTDADILQAFLQQVYVSDDDLPDELHLPDPVPEMELFEQWLTQRRGKKVGVEFPKIGDKAKLLRLARENALLLLGERRLEVHKRQTAPEALVALKESLKLPRLPTRIEAFDVSNLQGQDAVASMVLFHNARPRRSGYRRFKIRTVDGIDDFAMMAEVVGRRYRRLKQEGKPMPDLIVVDGGKGQLHAAKRVLDTLKLNDIPIMGLAKRLEEVFLPGDPSPWNLPKTSAALKLLQRVRDEAHRFAIQYHRRLRGRRTRRSGLDSVPGIGPAKRTALLKHFGSLRGVRAATESELAEVPGISEALARNIRDRLSG